jgi:hypothetical protein
MFKMQHRMFQYGYADGCFWLRQERHMLYVSFGVEKPGDWQFQINCATPDEAQRLYRAVDCEPLLVNHLSMQRCPGSG